MKFREFVSWCNKRAADGQWGMGQALQCLTAINTVRTQIPWRREKAWQIYDAKTNVSCVVEKVNEIIEYRKGCDVSAITR